MKGTFRKLLEKPTVPLNVNAERPPDSAMYIHPSIKKLDMTLFEIRGHDVKTIAIDSITE